LRITADPEQLVAEVEDVVLITDGTLATMVRPG